MGVVAKERSNIVTAVVLEAMLKRQLQALWSGRFDARKLAPLMIWGAPGVGKSSIVQDVAKSLGIGFIDVRLAQREPVDVRGLPVPNKEKKCVEWMVSGEWPREGRGIIMFDELTAADRTLQVAAYEMILDRRLGDLYTVPPGWFICAAGNRVEDRAVATTMSSALANRFMHVELESDAESWCQWASAHDIHPMVVGFIRARPQLLFNQKDENLERGWPSPRAWERVSVQMQVNGNGDADDKILDEMLRTDVYGLVGVHAGVEFMAFKKDSSCLINVYNLMVDPKARVKIPEKVDRLHAFCAAMVYHVWHGDTEEAEQRLLDGFYRLSLALPSSFAAMAMMAAMGKDDEKAEKMLSHALHGKWLEVHGKAFGRQCEASLVNESADKKAKKVNK